jgi:hypothetical protein
MPRDAQELLPGCPAIVGREAIRQFYAGLIQQLPRLAEPSAQPGNGAGVADPWVVDREAAVTLQGVFEGRSSPDLAEIDPEAQFREPIREPNPKGAGGGRLAVGQVGVPGGWERMRGPKCHELRSWALTINEPSKRSPPPPEDQPPSIGRGYRSTRNLRVWRTS